MVDAQSVVAVVTGAVLALLGGIGTLVVFVGTLAGVMEWSAGAWLLPLALVVGTGLLTYGAVDLAGDLWALVAGDGVEELTDAAGVRSLWRLLD